MSRQTQTNLNVNNAKISLPFTVATQDKLTVLQILSTVMTRDYRYTIKED